MVYNSMANEQQRSVVPAVTELKKPELSPPMAGTRSLTDTLPFWFNQHYNKAVKQLT